MDILQFRCHAFADRFPFPREVSGSVTRSTDMGESQNVERLRLFLSSPLPPLRGIAPEFDQTRLVWMKLQSELPHAFPQLLQKSLCISSKLKPQHGIVSVTHDEHLSARHLFRPHLRPYIEHEVQVQVR